MGSTAFRVGVAQAGLAIALGAAGMKGVSSFQRVYADFGIELPEITMTVIAVADFLSRYWYLAFILACFWPFLNWRIVSLLSPRSEAVIPRTSWYWTTWLVLFLVVVLAVIALFRPLVVLIAPHRLS
jgi:type II secretory pathway component PulF